MAKVGRFGNHITDVGGERFDSKAEADDYAMLCLYQKAGEITELRRQVTFTLQPAFVDREGVRQRAITWTADFTYVQGGVPTLWETKGFATDRFLIALKLFKFCYPEYKVWVHYVKPKGGRR